MTIVLPYIIYSTVIFKTFRCWLNDSFEEGNVTCMYVDFLMYLWGLLGIDLGISCGRKDRNKVLTLMLLVANLANTKCASAVKKGAVSL